MRTMPVFPVDFTDKASKKLSKNYLKEYKKNNSKMNEGS